MNNKSRPYYAPTNLSPLFFGCFDKTNKATLARKVLGYIDAAGIDAFPGGLPTTVVHSGEQWDYPNAWAPLQHFVAEVMSTYITYSLTYVTYLHYTYLGFACTGR